MTSRKLAIIFIALHMSCAVKIEDDANDVVRKIEDDSEDVEKKIVDVKKKYDSDNYNNYKDVEIEEPKIKIKGVDATSVVSVITALVAVLKYALGAVEFVSPAAFAALGPIFLGVVGLVSGVVVPNAGALALLIQGLIVLIQAAIGVIQGNPGMIGLPIPVAIIGLILIGPVTIIVALGIILEIFRAILAIIPVPNITITITG